MYKYITYIYIYIYIHIIYFRSSNRKFTWAVFEPTLAEFCSDALADLAVKPMSLSCIQSQLCTVIPIKFILNISIDLLSIYLSTYLPICLSIYLSIYLSICLSIYLSICMRLWEEVGFSNLHWNGAA